MNKQELLAAIAAWPDRMVELENRWAPQGMTEQYDEEKIALYDEAVSLMFEAEFVLKGYRRCIHCNRTLHRLSMTDELGTLEDWVMIDGNRGWCLNSPTNWHKPDGQ